MEKKRYRKTCIKCGRNFQSKRDTRKYCSDKCVRQYHKARMEQKRQAMKLEDVRLKACKSCGATFTDLSSQNNRQYCRTNCRKSGFEGANLFATCPTCDNPSWLVIHHKDFNPKNNEPSNHEYICKSCHTIRHKIHKSDVPYWQRKDVERSARHFEKRYADFGGFEKLREILSVGSQSDASRHFKVSRELVRQWTLIYSTVLS